MTLNEQFRFLSPVQAVKVTKENLQEVAEWCGGKVAKTISTHPKTKGQEVEYVWVPTPSSAKSSSAFPGMYVTRRCVMGKTEIQVTYAVFVARYFEQNYFETPIEAVDATWGKKDPKAHKSKPQQPAPQVNVFITDPSMSREQVAAAVAGAADGGSVIIGRDATL